MRGWKRVREAGAGTATPPRADANPWEDRPTLSQMTSSYAPSADEDARAERYSDWAGRMREKKARLHQEQDGPVASYWTTDALFEESRRLEHEELHDRPNPWRVQELLAVLDLRTGATPTDIGDAYRKLAKQHHPDRFVQADEETQRFHADKMISIAAAYRTLKTLEKTG